MSKVMSATVMQVICCVFWQSCGRLLVLAGRSETMVEYDVGFLPNGKITALKIHGYFLCGAFLDLGFNDMMVPAAGRRPGLSDSLAKSGKNRVTLMSQKNHHGKIRNCRKFL